MWQLRLRRPVFVHVVSHSHKDRRCLILPALMISSLAHIFALHVPCLRLIPPPKSGLSHPMFMRCSQTALSSPSTLSLKRKKPLSLPSTNLTSRPIVHHLSSQLSRHFEDLTIARSLTCYPVFVYRAMLITRLIQPFPANSLMHF